MLRSSLATVLLALATVLLALSVAPSADASPRSSTETLLVGTATDHYPYSYLDGNNRVTGFAVDLFDAVARVSGLKIRRVAGPTHELHRRFVSGEFPIAQVYTYVPGGDGDVLFTAPYLTLKGALFVRRGQQAIRTLEDLRHRSVIVGRGSTGETFLRGTGIPMTLVPVDTADASLRLLAAGGHDAALTSRLTGMAIIARDGFTSIEPTGPPIDELTISLCFASHDRDRLVQLNEGLAILYRTGDYERVYRRWFARYEPTSFTTEELAHYAAAVFFVAAALAVWVSWHQRRLSGRLARQARELRTMDAELAQSRRLRAVGEMVGGIAHEFNNLLTPIVLRVEMLREDRAGDQGLQRELEVISGAANRAATLTRKLLTFGRKTEQEPVEVRLADVVAANVDLVKPGCDPRVELHVEVSPDLPALVQNPADLHQIVLNLLMNARDAVHEKLSLEPAGQAAVTLMVESLPPLNGHRRAGQRLTVRDTGVGMRREVLERIFEPFFTTKEVGRGTGLGLATVWHLVQTCGGRVDVESTPGVGTIFRVDLPQTAERAASPVSTPAHS